MAYDRDDYGRGGRYGSRYGQQQGGYRGGDRDRDYRGNPEMYGPPRDRDDDRGFLDRAADEVRSWFGGDDDDDRGYDRQRDDVLAGRGWGGGSRYAATGSDYGQRSQSSFGGGERSSPTRYGRPQSDYGRGQGSYGGQSSGSQRDQMSGGRGQQQGSHSHFDPHYHDWRQRQIEQLDRDYEDYRRQHQSKFDSEFHGWRTQRQTKRQMLDQVDEHMEVLGSDGQHVGTVDKVRGDRIILTKNDQAAGGRHHSIECDWVQSVEGGKVMLSKSGDEAKRMWRDEERKGAFFGEEDGATGTAGMQGSAATGATQGRG